MKVDTEKQIEELLAQSLLDEMAYLGDILQKKVGENIGRWESMGFFFGSRYDRWPAEKLSKLMKEAIRDKANTTFQRWGKFKEKIEENIQNLSKLIYYIIKKNK